MPINTKQYLWRFFGFYLISYLAGMAIIYVIDSLLRANLRDIPLVLGLSYAVPYFLCQKITKNEGRFLTQEEQKRMVRKGTLIAWVISATPNVLYIGYCLFLKLIIPTNQIPGMLEAADISADSSVASLLGIPTHFLAIMLVLALMIYYGMIRLLVSIGFKKAAKAYKKVQDGIVQV